MIPDDLQAALAGLDPEAPLLVALDFDGTLSELVSQPHLARPVPGVLDALGTLNDPPRTRVALLSGRARADLAQVSGAAEVAHLIGSHGQESGVGAAPLDPREAAALASARARVEALAAAVPGSLVEDKPAGLAVHVRNAPPEAGERLLEDTRAVAEQLGLHPMAGKLVVEMSVRPLDKGTALRDLMTGLGHPRVVFAGDDVTDETAMRVLGPDDLGIRVGPGDSVARFRVPDPPAMLEVLQALVAARTR